MNIPLASSKKMKLTSSSGDGIGPLPLIRLFSLAV
jgi:hypothetical protein